MASGASITITGDKQTDRALRSLERNIQRKFIRSAMRKSAKNHILPDARARVPVDTGALETSLKVRASRRSRKGFGMEVQTSDKPFQGNQYYGWMVEMGTKHQEAQPFLRPALWGNEAVIRREFITDLNELIREAARVGA